MERVRFEEELHPEGDDGQKEGFVGRAWHGTKEAWIGGVGRSMSKFLPQCLVRAFRKGVERGGGPD